MCKFFIRTSFQQLLLLTCKKKNAAEMMFVQKICMFNVDEIDTWTNLVLSLRYRPRQEKKVSENKLKTVLHFPLPLTGKK